jgi:DNA-binding transcriptional MerR regulator
VSVDIYPPKPTLESCTEGAAAVSRLNRANAVAWGVTIGQLCSLFSLTPRAIRFYEERGLVTVARDGRNRRIFDHQARQRLQFIADLRRARLSLHEIRDVLDEANGDETQLKQQVLAKLAAQLQALDATRRDLIRTIEHFAREPLPFGSTVDRPLADARDGWLPGGPDLPPWKRQSSLESS